MNPHTSWIDGYDSEFEITVDSAINFNINECDFQKLIVLRKNLTLINLQRQNLQKQLRKTGKVRREITIWNLFLKNRTPENCVFVPPQVNLELWKLLRTTKRKYKIYVNTAILIEHNECISKYPWWNIEWCFLCAKYCSEKSRYSCHNSFLGKGQPNPEHEPWKQGQIFLKQSLKVKWQVLNLNY